MVFGKTFSPQMAPEVNIFTVMQVGMHEDNTGIFLR